MPHDWFSKLTGFREESYQLTRSQLDIEGDELVSTVNGKRYGAGSLSLPTLAELRNRVDVPRDKRSTVRGLTGEARAMHADPELEGALFQVASQFNLLEMAGPSVSPEDGVTRYGGDHTQGPACAIAAGGRTAPRCRGHRCARRRTTPRLAGVLFALPVAYGSGRQSAWEPFARLVLEATYEATLSAAVEQSLAGRSNTVLLTRVGGGVFGNRCMDR